MARILTLPGLSTNDYLPKIWEGLARAMGYHMMMVVHKRMDMAVVRGRGREVRMRCQPEVVHGVAVRCTCIEGVVYINGMMPQGGHGIDVNLKTTYTL